MDRTVVMERYFKNQIIERLWLLSCVPSFVLGEASCHVTRTDPHGKELRCAHSHMTELRGALFLHLVEL